MLGLGVRVCDLAVDKHVMYRSTIRFCECGNLIARNKSKTVKSFHKV